jgi:two-component system, chemotaxis family, protein-glutamate methylesterase/glutaminase
VSGAIAIGASAGGLEVLKHLAAKLLPDLPVPVLVVLHIGPHRSHLPELLTRAGQLEAKHAEDGEKLRPATIYVAPADHHLLVEEDRAVLTRGPKENWARPAIDPLFRSAALNYGRGLIGVVLSGKLNDGTAGLYEIKRRRGTTIIQDPKDAAEPSMPRSALEHVDVDHIVDMLRLPSLLAELAASRPVSAKTLAG